MKRQSLQILHRYREHLLEREQASLQDKIAVENEQKARLLQLHTRVHATHEAKQNARVVEDLSSLDDAAAYLHGRVTMARRALSIAGQAREEVLERILTIKKERDQVGLLLEKEKQGRRRDQDDAERRQIDDLVTSRYAMAGGNR
jgi:flagellar biosynthesis chaperone FliJ